MARVRLKRFKVSKPSPDALATYMRMYTGRELYHLPDDVPPITSHSLFGVDAPLVFDLGCGRGEFIVGQAAQRPDEFFVGFDWHVKSLWDGVNRAVKADVTNVRFVKADFRQALALVPGGAVSEVYLLFPPPIMEYGKRKKDPLMEASLRAIHRVLEPGGWFHFMTDGAEYFQLKLTLIAWTGLFEVLKTTSQGLDEGHTRFQRIWERFDVQAHRAECRKVAEISPPGPLSR
ncbi:MAG: methyltransferase domain-containing protein, partial [Anaerolineae bacterium]|nr:methyltransferase domain-containing protein [Anaerolineae bacterium]